MKHPSSREMFRCWNELRGHRLVPERDQLDLAALRKVLGDSLVLSLDHAAGYPVRLAGTRVRALFGRELKTLPFISLWETSSRSLLHVFVTMAGEGSAPMVAEAVGRSEFAETTVEMLLLPLARGDAPDSRLIGVLAPPAVPSWLGRSPVGPLTLRCFRHVPAGSPPPVERPPRRGTIPPRAPLVVHQGGRQPTGAGRGRDCAEARVPYTGH